MSDWTPRTLTTEEVRKAYTLDIIHTADGRVVGFETSPENLAEFDRWLAQHDAEVAKATEERIITLLETDCKNGSIEFAIALIKEGQK